MPKTHFWPDPPFFFNHFLVLRCTFLITFSEAFFLGHLETFWTILEAFFECYIPNKNFLLMKILNILTRGISAFSPASSPKPQPSTRLQPFPSSRCFFKASKESKNHCKTLLTILFHRESATPN